MDSPTKKLPLWAPEPPPGTQPAGSSNLPETASVIRTDRLYQIAAVTAGLFLLATAF